MSNQTETLTGVIKQVIEYNRADETMKVLVKPKGGAAGRVLLYGPAFSRPVVGQTLEAEGSMVVESNGRRSMKFFATSVSLSGLNFPSAIAWIALAGAILLAGKFFGWLMITLALAGLICIGFVILLVVTDPAHSTEKSIDSQTQDEVSVPFKTTPTLVAGNTREKSDPIPVLDVEGFFKELAGHNWNYPEEFRFHKEKKAYFAKKETKLREQAKTHPIYALMLEDFEAARYEGSAEPQVEHYSVAKAA